MTHPDRISLLSPRSRRTHRARALRLEPLRWLPLAAIAIAVLVLGTTRALAGAPAGDAGVRTAIMHYVVPAVQLVRDDGKVVSLPEEMNDGRPVVLNFIFTSCGTVCPLMSQVFSQFQQSLGAADRNKVHLMSISIDPEEDTPVRLRDYARKFHAGPEWQHYTGTVEASVAAQRAFGISRGDKMSHAPVTLLRAAPGVPWLRIDGLVRPDELLAQYHRALAEAAPASQSTPTIATR